jgi:NAD(P)-dependent dehydrogenase (short-subunit alcohol dehydrogenase family)
MNFCDISFNDWRKVVDINLNGAFLAIKEAIPLMRKAGKGSIVIIGSAAIVAGGGGRADYAASKAGLEGLNRAVTKNFAPEGIRCNIVHPSLIETDLLKQRHPDPAKRKELGEKEVPLRRLGQPEDIAAAALFLLSDAAGYITGQSLFVDGGRTFCK